MEFRKAPVMRKPLLLSLFSFSMLLAACGGGGGGGGSNLPPGGGGTPTPTPVSTATPTPTPTPTATPTPGTLPSPLVGADGAPLAGPSKAPVKGGWLATAVASALNFPVQHGWYGNGQTVAIVIDSDVNRADVQTYLSYNGTPGASAAQRVTTVAVSPLAAPTIVPGTNGPSGSQLEATLDVETVAGLAPGANIIIYQVDTITSDQSLTNAYAKIDSDHLAYVADSSFGGCEFSGTSTQEDPVLATGASHGIAWFASSGDDGNLCQTSPNVVGPNWPAVNPHVIGVGGNETDYGLGNTLTTPSVWNDVNGAGGGGISDTPPQSGLTPVPIPPYQSSIVPGLLTACSSPATGHACSSSFRNVPDFSMPAAYDAIYLGGWQPVDGTSWSSPLAAALFAELYEYCGASGGPISGVTEPAAIAYYAYHDSPNAFLDITGGNDQRLGLSPFYAALSGFDNAGGLGVPNGGALIQTACPNRTPRSPLFQTHITSVVARSQFQPRSTGYTVDISPRVPGLSDQGERPSESPTAIQLVMQPDNAQSAEAAVVKALQAAGFKITLLFADHMVVNAEASSATVSRYFHTRMHNVWQNRYGTRYMPTTEIVVPAEIAPYVASVSLDNVAHERHLRPYRQ